MNMQATTAQKELLYRLMKKAELAMDRTTGFHQMVARNAHITPPETGTSVDVWISTLTKREASLLIDELQDSTE